MIVSVLLAFALAFALSQVANLVTTVYLHRALSHRALTLSPAVVWACRIVTWITTGIRPRQWVAVHRKHHAFTDEPPDPHSPVQRGFRAVMVGNVVLYRRAARESGLVERYARDIPADHWDRVLFDHAVVGLGLGIAALCAVFGVRVGLLAAGLHAVMYLSMSAAVNAVGHTFGARPHPNTSRNNQWLAWLTAGEGLHNNHHAAPTSARLALQRGDVDPGWWAVRSLQALRLARIRHDRPHLKPEAAA